MAATAPHKRRDVRGRRGVPHSEAATAYVCDWKIATSDEVADDTWEGSEELDSPRRRRTPDAAPSIPGHYLG